jgi:sensor histidine kinase YesM
LRIYKEDTKLIFSVSDNGIGFNQTEELFKNLQNGKLGTSNEGSTGIVFCRNIIKKKTTDNLPQ